MRRVKTALFWVKLVIRLCLAVTQPVGFAIMLQAPARNVWHGSACNILNNLCCASLKLNCSNSSDVGFICVSDGGNGAPSLFNMNFSLKQLVGFAVVMVAAGLLWIGPSWIILVWESTFVNNCRPAFFFLPKRFWCVLSLRFQLEILPLIFFLVFFCHFHFVCVVSLLL